MEKPSRFLANSSTALEQLRGLINQHESTPGTPLPTERELSETLGVGRREVRRALDVLEEEGRIWRKQGKGTFIGPAALWERVGVRASDRTFPQNLIPSHYFHKNACREIVVY